MAQAYGAGWLKEKAIFRGDARLAAGLQSLKRASAWTLDFLLPPRCAACGTLTDRHIGLCSACWSELSFITRPFCAQCGRPFEFHIPGTSRCAACLRRPPGFDKAFSPLVYEEKTRQLILQFKHGDQLGHGQLLAQFMAPHVAAFGFDDPVILPVPLHAKRIMRRRFNQSAVLAQRLSRLTGAQVDVLTLKRTRATPMQQGLTAKQRHKNVRGAFAVSPKRKARVQGRDVLLIDDVFTTGATVEACTRVLRKAGAAKIGILTVARVVGPDAAII